MSYFYSHLVEIDSVVIELDTLNLSEEQKKHLAQLFDELIFQEVLDLVLSKLAAVDKKEFVEKLAKDRSDKQLMVFAKSKIDSIEDELIEAVKNLTEELLADIQHSKKGEEN
ncbi:hypothetical protein M1563_04600 [Patescibacteria group bacterium]|nr:hypothetical protein [Patescibacteria group bacterium]MCL5409731.1 hypothetical protein [Patescibacteria group bacterium]